MTQKCTGRAKLELTHFPDPDAQCYDPDLNVALTVAQRQILTWECFAIQSVESKERAQVLRDLSLLAGFCFLEEMLVTWSLSQGGVHLSELCWHDGRDPRETDTAASQPKARFRVRRNALRIATLLILEMEGIHQA